MTEIARITLGPQAPWASVLSRVFGVIAAETVIPVDRVLDAQLALDQLAEGARAAGLAELELAFSVEPQAARVSVGPTADPEAILANARPPGIEGALERLVDQLRIEEGGGGRCLVLAFDAR